MNIQKIIQYWLEEASEALKVAWHLYEKDDYSYSLFFGHLAIEKLLKAIYVVRKGEHAPYLHNLLRLSEISGIELTDARRDLLIRITTFNVESRYPDERRSFRKKCTQEFTSNELNQIEDIFKWLKSKS
ncbi:MAG: HEPN domain-containing protein [Deltaproteobacteria bacterium]|nr:HEPN domain-containing protein [Deltaproteobacteria bacterium]MBW2116275.1 HEPN domain-containing protein [Deltaproteobacteria bacterium]